MSSWNGLPPLVKPDAVNHPTHYGADTTYETIKVIEAWGLGFCDGNVVKYLSRWRKKGGIDDLRKAAWYLNRFIKQQEAQRQQSATSPDGRAPDA